MDLAYLDRLCKGNCSRMAEFIALYVQEAPGLFGQLEAMLNAGDAEQLAQAAHALHPHVHYVGDMPLCGLLAQVRQRAHAEGAAACAAPVQECLVLHRQLMQELQQWAATIAAAGNG